MKISSMLSKIFTIIIAFLFLNLSVNAEMNGVAKINDTLYSSLREALNAAEEGATITLLSDITVNQVITINKGITLNGEGHKITSTLTGSNATLLINTSGETTINDITIETNTRAVAINNSNHHFTINNSTLRASHRGITVNTDDNENAILNVNNCVIENNQISNYDEEIINQDYRGISLWEYQNSTIHISNTTIQGFTYTINVTAPESIYDSKDTKLVIDHCILKGRAGINHSNTYNFNIEIKNSEILGINNQSGSNENFGNIVVYSSSNVNLNVVNTKLINFQNEVGLNNPNALQYMFDIRSGGNTIKISGNTQGIDTTNKIQNIFRFDGIPKSDTRENEIEITNGTYFCDVAPYMANGYEGKWADGTYQVSKIQYNPTLEIKEFDLNAKVDSITIGPINTSYLEKILLNALEKTEMQNQNVKVTIDTNAVELSETEKEEFNKNKQIEGAIFTHYFDITLNIANINTNNRIGNIAQLDDKITFAILLPDTLQIIPNGYQRKYYIVREHENTYDVLETTLSDNGALTFETDKFSTFALMYVDEKIEEATYTIENPKTYDGILVYLVMGSLSLIGVLGIGKYLKKQMHI